MSFISALFGTGLSGFEQASPLLFWAGLQIGYAIIIAALIAVLIPCLKITNPIARQGLWSLVLLRLVLPIDLASPLSLREMSQALITQLPVSKQPVKVTAASGRTDTTRDFAREELYSFKQNNLSQSYSSPVHKASVFEPAVQATPAPVAKPTDMANHSAFALFLRATLLAWVFGIIFFALRYMRDWNFFMQMARHAPQVKDARICIRIEEWRLIMDVRRPVILKAGTRNISPFTMGIFKPLIYVPRTLLAPGREQALDAALGHEMAHIRRLDDLWIKAEAIVKILYFFFPLVWWAGREIEAAREEACDALALSRGKRSAKAYAEGLLTTLKLAARTPHGAPCPGLSQDKAGLKARLLQLKSAGVSRWSNLRALGLVMVVGGCGLPLAQAADTPPAPATVNDAFSAAEAPTPPAPPMEIKHGRQGFDKRFTSAIKAHDEAISRLTPTYDASAEMTAHAREFEERMRGLAERYQARALRDQERLQRDQERLERDQLRLEHEAEREMHESERTAHENEQHLRHEMRQMRAEIRDALRSSQQDALKQAMDAMAQVEEALDEIDWEELAQLNERLIKDHQPAIDVAAILRDAGISDLQAQIARAVEAAHAQALEQIEQSLKSVEQRAQQQSSK